MPTSFTFSANTINTNDYLALSGLTRGSGPGVDNARQASGLALNQTIDPSGDVDIFAITLIAGRTYTLDVDRGFGDGPGRSVDLELDLINQEGDLVLSRDGASNFDAGSTSLRDPRVTFTANVTGTYYVAVHAQEGEYRDGQFSFRRGDGGTGDYSLVVSTASVPERDFLTSGADSRSGTAGRDNIHALGGNDNVFLGGGFDLASGGSGNDALFGQDGDDELSGGSGADALYGGNGRDVLIGGLGRDVLRGGLGGDALNGSWGKDALEGSGGHDRIFGDNGNDRIFGGTGDDFIRGGLGADTMSGNGGADVFHFLRGEATFDNDGFRDDRILGFQTADAIDLSDIANLTWRGQGDFTGSNQLRIADLRSFNGFVEVQVNLSGGDAPEMTFLVQRADGGSLRESDFIL